MAKIIIAEFGTSFHFLPQELGVGEGSIWMKTLNSRLDQLYNFDARIDG